MTEPAPTAFVCFRVPGPPRGKGRPRTSTRRGFVQLYTDKETAAYERTIAKAAGLAMEGRPPYDEPVNVSLWIKFAPPASASKRDRAAMLEGKVLPAKKPDVDNTAKAILDSCNGIAYRDDALVVGLHAWKLYAEQAGVTVQIAPVVQP